MGTRNRKKKEDDKKPAGDGGNDSGEDSPGAAKKTKAQAAKKGAASKQASNEPRSWLGALAFYCTIGVLLSAVAILVMMAMPPKTDRTGFYAPPPEHEPEEELEFFENRDGDKIYFREYRGTSWMTVVGLHGEGSNMEIFDNLARNVKSANFFLMDVREHGHSHFARARKVGDIERDLEDFMTEIVIPRTPRGRFFYMGHGAAGNLGLKIADDGHPLNHFFTAFMLMAPYMGPEAKYILPAFHERHHDTHHTRIAVLDILNNWFGYDGMNALPVAEFNVNADLQPHAKSEYSYAMYKSFFYPVQDHVATLMNTTKHMAVFTVEDDVGYDDDIFPQDVFIYAKHVVFFTVSEGGHNGFMDTEAIHARMKEWIKEVRTGDFMKIQMG